MFSKVRSPLTRSTRAPAASLRVVRRDADEVAFLGHLDGHLSGVLLGLGKGIRLRRLESLDLDLGVLPGRDLDLARNVAQIELSVHDQGSGLLEFLLELLSG